MAEKIPGEVLSPMIDKGVLYFCEGDVFKVSLKLELYAMGEKYALKEGDTVEVTFRDRSGAVTKVFSSVAENENGEENSETVENGNCITLDFDKETTLLFTKGKYLYDVCIKEENGNRTTVANDNVAVVM